MLPHRKVWNNVIDDLAAALRHASGELKLESMLIRPQIEALDCDLGLTAIYVTHDQREALALSDRIALFNQGRIDQLASPTEIYRKPATAFAAQFVGDTGWVATRFSVAQARLNR